RVPRRLGPDPRLAARSPPPAVQPGGADAAASRGQTAEPQRSGGAVRGALRVALTQTRNAYTDMPSSTAELERIADRLEQVRKANLEHNAALVRAAAERGAHVVGLGELFSAPYFAHEERPMWLELA